MNTKENIQNDLYDILKRSSWWQRAIGSQFVSYLVLFVTQVVERVRLYADRALQESYLALATNRTSILAGAESVGYVGLKISPSTGNAIITNNTGKRLTLPAMTQCLSPLQIRYSIMESVDLNVGESGEYAVSQLEVVTQDYVVDEEKPWRSILLPQSMTTGIHKLIVKVNGEVWTNAFKFRGCDSSSRAYMEYYKSTDQLGALFGNGLVGLVPKAGDVITLELWMTKGDTTLLDGQKLELIDANDFSGQGMDVDITTSTSITGGLEGEDIESIKAGALYTTVYDDQLSWDGDYRTFIKKNVAGIAWLSVWGEKEQEQIIGFKELRNLNTVFISCYATNKADEKVNAEILALFNGREGWNEEYKTVARKEALYTVQVSGSVIGGSSPDDVEIAVRDELNSLFGKNAIRPNAPSQNEIWSTIEALRVKWEIKEFKVTYTGLLETVPIDTFHYLDIDSSSIQFTF